MTVTQTPSEFLKEFQALKETVQWLNDNPHFDQKPASILEFIGPGYLDIEHKIRLGLKKALREIFGDIVGTHRIAKFERALFTGAIGIGKQLDPDEIILTPSGWRTVDDLEVGDEVTGRDGLPHSVLNTTRWEDVERYRITFKDGTWIDSGSEHLWTVNRSYTSRDSKELTLSSAELSRLNLRNPASNHHYYSIPLVDPVEFDPQELDLDPYLMGQLLGDGCLKRTVTLASADLEIVNYITLPPGVSMIRRADENRWGFTTGQRGGLSRVNPMLSILRKYGLMECDSYSKFIPEQYMFASIKDRTELLRGLMDSDGTVSGTRGTRFTSANKFLARDVVDLIRSLGGYASISSSPHPNTRHGYYYEVSFWVPFCPFNLKRKSALWFSRDLRKPKRYISSVQKIENGPGVCISIDSPDHLYVTKDFIVTHNTTFASICLPYMTHWVLCLKDPQDFFELLPGSRIAFMQMSTSEQQAREVVFGDIFARIDHSAWFRKYYPRDPNMKRQIRFSKDVWIIPGDSRETSFEGYNILGGILDEMDSHQVTKEKDYADVGYDAIHSRIASRFIDPITRGHRGLLICIGQMKKTNGFAARKLEEYEKDPNAHVARMTIWESLGWSRYLVRRGPNKGQRDSFWYDPKRKEIRSQRVIEIMGTTEGLIEVPEAYRVDFERNPQKALRDLAGIPPTVVDAFISLSDRVELASITWQDQHRTPDGEASNSPVTTSARSPQFEPWFRANGDPRRRVMHIDLAVSGEGDALGMAMGHVDHMLTDEENRERKPYIVIDCLLRMKGPSHGEIMLSDVRKIVYHLRDDLGFRLKTVTMDGFNCLTGATRVPLADGRVFTMKQLADRFPNGGVEVQSYHVFAKQVMPGKLLRAWKTKTSPVINVILSNGHRVECTPDHLFMIEGGEYIPAVDLEYGQPLVVYGDFSRKVEGILDLGDFKDVYDLQIEHYNNFALGTRVFVHNSTDTLQQLRRKHFNADYLSIDRNTLPYEDLRDAIYEKRISWPPYLTYVRIGDTELEHVLNRELLQLQDNGKKIDHPPNGSKDLADAVAGVCTTLMGDRMYHKGVSSLLTPSDLTESDLIDDTTASRATSAFEPAILNRPRSGRPLNPDFVPQLSPLIGSGNPYEIQLPGRRR